MDSFPSYVNPPHAAARVPARVAPIDAASWWIVPNYEGNLKEGRLYFGVTLAKPTDDVMHVGVNFRGYLPNGDTTSCTTPGGEGPGVSVQEQLDCERHRCLRHVKLRSLRFPRFTRR